MARFHRVTALLLALLLTAGLLPARVLAEEQETISFQSTYVNPLYADVLTKADLLPAKAPGIQPYSNPEYLTDIDEVGKLLREPMKNREETAVVYVWAQEATQESVDALCKDITDAAVKHTGVPTEGDYLRWQYAGYDAKITGHAANDGYNFTIAFTFTHYTTAQQEAEMDAAVEKLLRDLDLDLKSDYEKAKDIYDYICANVKYDKKHLEDDSYKLKHTAYAALIQKTAVCQGYAVLLYRLLLECDIDCRFIGGTGNGGPHGWNIVELASLYYNADSTWDAGKTEYDYFLTNEENFVNHKRYEEYTTNAFHSAYPTSSKDYAPTVCSGDHVWNQGTVTKEPTESETGVRTYTCRNCGEHKTEDIEKLPHTHSYTSEVTPPTCTQQGYTTHTCACGDTYVGNYVDATGHSYDTETWKNDETGHWHACTVCGDKSDVAAHDYAEATCTVPSTCKDCGATEGEALGHTEVIDEAVNATCTEAGKTEGKHCSVCSEVIVAQEEVPAKGHDYQDGACSVCGEKEPAEAGVTRISGDNRVKTALKIAETLKETLKKDTFDTIIVVNGANEKFPDPLTGSYLASVAEAPILMCNVSSVSQETLDFIQENLDSNGKIYLLGGVGSISEEVEAKIGELAKNVVRLAGDNRYVTNLKILEEAENLAGASAGEILIARGDNFADSLSASATGLPILVVDGNGKLRQDQKDYLLAHKTCTVTILGGVNSVSEDIRAEIETLLNKDVERVAGNTRGETSAAIAERYFPNAKFATITYSQGPADGLCGGVLANALNAPMLLTNAGQTGVTNGYIAKHNILSGYVLGGPNSVSDDTARAAFGLAENAQIKVK